MAKVPTKPAGSAPSSPTDPRPRAQVSYEGEDEFSTMSLDPTRRARVAVELEPSNPGERKAVHVDDLKSKGGGLVGFIKRIFDK